MSNPIIYCMAEKTVEAPLHPEDSLRPANGSDLVPTNCRLLQSRINETCNRLFDSK